MRAGFSPVEKKRPTLQVGWRGNKTSGNLGGPLMTLKCWGSNGLSRAFLLPARLLFSPPTHFPFTQAIPASAAPQAPALAFPRGRQALGWADARGVPAVLAALPCPLPRGAASHTWHRAEQAGCCLPSSLVPRMLETQAAPRFLSFFLLRVAAVSLPRPSPAVCPRKVSLFPPAPTQAPLSLGLQLLPAPCRHSLLLPAVPAPAASRCRSLDRSHDFLLLLAAGDPRWSSPGPGPQLCCSLSAGPAALLCLLPLGCCLAAVTIQCSQTLPHTTTSRLWSPSPARRALGRGRRGCQDWSLIPTPWCACTLVMLSP